MSECMCVCAGVCLCARMCAYVSLGMGVHVCEWLYHVKVRDELVTVDSILPPRGLQGSDFNSVSAECAFIY